jgi:hypothetical protein
MPFRPNYPLASLEAFVDGARFGPEVKTAKVNFLGINQGRIAGTIYHAVPMMVPGVPTEDDPNPADVPDPSGAMHWERLDQVTMCEVDEDRGVIKVAGTSERLMTDVGLPEGQARIEYRIKPRECAGCR